MLEAKMTLDLIRAHHYHDTAIHHCDLPISFACCMLCQPLLVLIY